MKHYLYSLNGVPNFVVSVDGKNIVKVRSNDPEVVEDMQRMANVEGAKTLAKFMRSGFSYWDHEEVSKEAADAFVNSELKLSPIAERLRLNAKGSDRRINPADTGSG